jgi:hypothetical protein
VLCSMAHGPHTPAPPRELLTPLQEQDWRPSWYHHASESRYGSQGGLSVLWFVSAAPISSLSYPSSCLSKATTAATTCYTQSSVCILRNTETASTHQSVYYLNAFPRCDPSMPWRPCCQIQGESPEIIAFSGAEPF